MDLDSSRPSLRGGEGAITKLPWYIIPVTLGVAAGLPAALLTMSVAWDHNPQGAFHDESGIDWPAWLAIGLFWFVMVGAVITAIPPGLAAAFSRIHSSRS